MQKKISIQGNLGSYSHIASDSFFGSDIALLERDSFDEVFEDMTTEKADHAVIAIENSTHGSIYGNYDLLSKHQFFITGEIYDIVNFHLIGMPEAELQDISDLHMHPVGLTQIQNFLHTHKQINGHSHPDNAGAVAMIMKNQDKSQAGVASRMASKIYGGKILVENIQDNPKNYTRFFVLSRTSDYDSLSNKTTIQFNLEHKAGALLAVLDVLAKEGISLTKIESRPIHNTEWEYTFYIDFMGGMCDPKIQDMLEEIKKYTLDLRVLGSYVNGKYVNT